MASCRGCGAAVTFVPTAATGKLMPLDRLPSERGNVRLDRTDWRRPTAVVLAGAELEEAQRAAVEPLYLAHFVTCPRYTAGEPKPKPAELPANVVPFPRGGRRAT